MKNSLLTKLSFVLATVVFLVSKQWSLAIFTGVAAATVIIVDLVRR